MGDLHFSLTQKVRHWAKRIPFMNEIYDFCTTTFCPDYAEDALRASKNCGFLKDPEFLEGYAALLKQEPGTKTRWRAHVSQWAGRQASKLEGDFVEAGVNKAAFSASLMKYVKFERLKDKTFYLIDTYSGLVESLVDKSERAAFKNEYVDSYQFVVDSFKSYPNVKVIRGVVPDVLPTLNITKIAYLSIDMNCAAPERAALEFFWPKMVKGGIILLDDYAFSGRKLQQMTADDFAHSVDSRILTLPTGQGILIA